MYSRLKPAPTLSELNCTVPENFELCPVKRDDKQSSFVAMYKYRGKPFASISWYKQRHVMAFVLPESRIIEWKSMPDAIEALTMMALLLRLKGEM